MARLKLPDIKPSTMGLICLTALWVFFQWRDPTPPPILDQILVASFSVWFANAAIEKKKEDSAPAANPPPPPPTPAEPQKDGEPCNG